MNLSVRGRGRGRIQSGRERKKSEIIVILPKKIIITVEVRMKPKLMQKTKPAC